MNNQVKRLIIIVKMESFCFKVLILAVMLSSLSEVIICNETRQFNEQTAIEGTSYKMKCTDAGSFPQMSSIQTIVIWSINGTLPAGSKYKLLTDGLVIRNVSREDTFSNYTCTVLDRFTFTPLRSDQIKLKLRQRTGKLLVSKNFGEPVAEKKVRVWGIVKQWVKLQCNMFSRPSPSFEWRKGESGEKIKNSSNLYKIVEDESTSNLTIFLHNETFFGEYSCKASNNHGESIQHFLLIEGYKPKSPFIYPTYIGKDRLTLKVEPQEVFRADMTAYKEVLPITSYLIQYIEAESLLPAAGEFGNGRFQTRNKKWTTITVTADGIIPHIPRNERGIFEMRNLKGNTTYFVRCAVANAAAVSDFSPSIRITTDAVVQDTTTNTIHNASEVTSRKEEYGRASSLEPQNLTATVINSTQPKSTSTPADCKSPQYKKTIIRTTTLTTMIENLRMDNDGKSANETSPLVKKHVEEDTSIEQMLLCSV